MKEYYTYAYLREDRTPYYIGKGEGNRAYSSRHTCSVPKDKNRIIFLKKNLTEEDAFKHETYLISVLGRKNLGTGILRNLTNGGEGVSGMRHTEESKEKIGRASKGKNLTPNHIEKIRQSKIGNTWNKGKTISQEQREQIRKTLTGVKHTKERRRNQSEAKIGVKHSEERNNKKSELQKGKHWYNNGKINKFDYKCPDGFVSGMIKRR